MKCDECRAVLSCIREDGLCAECDGQLSTCKNECKYSC